MKTLFKVINDKSIKTMCPKCRKIEIEWKEVYYKENEKLIKPKKIFMGWCLQCKTYVLN